MREHFESDITMRRRWQAYIGYIVRDALFIKRGYEKGFESKVRHNGKVYDVTVDIKLNEDEALTLPPAKHPGQTTAATAP
jgi:hypothetical protein